MPRKGKRRPLTVNSSEWADCACLELVISHHDIDGLYLGGGKTSSTELEPLQLTIDQTGSNPTERRRVLLEGGLIEDGRISGQLEPARTIGDVDMKSKAMSGWVIARPDISFYIWPHEREKLVEQQVGQKMQALHNLGRCRHLVVLATDGLWDVVSGKILNTILQDVHREKQESGQHERLPFATAAANQLVRSAADLGSTDDISVVAICF